MYSVFFPSAHLSELDARQSRKAKLAILDRCLTSIEELAIAKDIQQVDEIIDKLNETLPKANALGIGECVSETIDAAEHVAQEYRQAKP